MSVSEDYNVHGLAELAFDQVAGIALREYEAGAVGAGGDAGCGPLDVVNHADVHVFHRDDPGGISQAVAGFRGVFVTPYRQHRRQGFQVVQHSNALQVAAVENQINTGKGPENGVGQVATAAG